jgi:hypothetical protein
MDLQYRDAVQEKFREEFGNTPYHEQLLATRAKGIEMYTAHRELGEQKWVEQRIRENSEVRAAKRESYKHDLYHGDEMYSFYFKSLRIIPVTNRHQSNLPVSRLPPV